MRSSPLRPPAPPRARAAPGHQKRVMVVMVVAVVRRTKMAIGNDADVVFGDYDADDDDDDDDDE